MASFSDEDAVEYGPAILIKIAQEVSKIGAGVEFLKEARLAEAEARRQMKAEMELALATLRKEQEEMQEEHDERLDVLEKDKIKIIAFATGLGTVSAGSAVVFLDWVKNHFHILVAVLWVALSGCAADEPATKLTKDFRWSGETVPYVIDLNCPGACVRAAEEAFLRWEDRGVEYLNLAHAIGVPEHLAGAITVSCGELPFDDETGYADWRTFEHDRSTIESARIILDLCDARTADHELGHALGLDHSPVKGDAMFPSLDGYGQHVPEEQLDWVR